MANSEPLDPREAGADAEYQIGVRYLLGDATTQDLSLSREWLEKSAARAHEDAAALLRQIPQPRTAEQTRWFDRHPRWLLLVALLPIVAAMLLLASQCPAFARNIASSNHPAPSAKVVPDAQLRGARGHNH